MMNRRRYMGGGPGPFTNPYITDGLAFYLDGEYNNGLAAHESNINYWKELVSGKKLLPQGTISWGGNYADFNGNVYFGFTDLGANIVPSIRNNTIYIELILEPINHGKSSNNGYIAFGDSVRGVWLWDNAKYQYSSFSYRTNSNNSISLNPWNEQKKINRILIRPNKVTIDGSVINSANGGFVNNNDCYIGKLPNYGNAIFKLYSLRVYNRILSEEEIAANYSIDQLRFGIT